MNAGILDTTRGWIFFPCGTTARRPRASCAISFANCAPMPYSSRARPTSTSASPSCPPHKLPIAIYSYFSSSDGLRHSAYYPFASIRPRWQAITAAREIGASAASSTCHGRRLTSDGCPHRYADGELRRARTSRPCSSRRVEDFDACGTSWWRSTAICPRGLTRALPHVLLTPASPRARRGDGPAPRVLHGREIERARGEYRQARRRHGRVPQLRALGARRAHRFRRAARESAPSPAAPLVDRGIALTPYSYERLDSLAGYEAGMPNPGFYHRVWDDRARGARDSHRHLLALAAEDLRKRGQAVSTADLVAVEVMAGGLASLRGHAEVWRRDLVDAIVGALVKEDLEYGVEHPFLAALNAVLRGGERGRLAEGTSCRRSCTTSAAPSRRETSSRSRRAHDRARPRHPGRARAQPHAPPPARARDSGFAREDGPTS